MFKIFLSLLCVFITQTTLADEGVIPFTQGAGYNYCFRPAGPSCEKLLVNAIDGTKKELKIQAYTFTNRAIKKAILRAKERGISVRIIVDKAEQEKGYPSSVISSLKNAGIPIFVDNEPMTAHNKIMIFDDSSFFTGSFNFSQAAEYKNAENGLLIYDDQHLCKLYTDYWESRFNVSEKYK